MSVSALASMYRHLLGIGRIMENGAAHSRLKFFEEILERRLRWRKMKNKMPKMLKIT
jgi:hypothetical protein